MTFLEIVRVKTYFDKICDFLIFIITSQNNRLFFRLPLSPQEAKKIVDNVHNLVYKSILTFFQAVSLWITLFFFIFVSFRFSVYFNIFVQFAQTPKRNAFSASRIIV